MSQPKRWVVPNEGDRVSVSYRGRRDRIKTRHGIVRRVEPVGAGVRVHLDAPWSGATVTFDPDGQDDYGTVTSPTHRYNPEAYRLKVVVPVSQVRHPGVYEGDTVKVRQGSTAYRVEGVDNGYVTLEDGRSVPVTEITAFDEDVDDYDAFQILPEMWKDTIE